jgi:DNA-binding LytR/AlgR family response regulator
MKAIIVDDEPKAIELLKSYLGHFSKIKLVGTFRNGLKALEFLSKEKVELIFLDINMPHISGISLSRLIPPETKIIFTTAYAEFAVESYEVAAVDYLLKPISLERFSKAVSKMLAVAKTPVQIKREIVSVKSGNTTHRIRPEEILYLEKDGNYITYYLADRKILARETVQQAMDILPASFAQVHRSFIVNIEKVTAIEKESLRIDRYDIPIGASYKDSVMEKISASS